MNRTLVVPATPEMALASHHAIWRPALGLAATMLLSCGLVYSATVTGLGGILFPSQATAWPAKQCQYRSDGHRRQQLSAV